MKIAIIDERTPLLAERKLSMYGFFVLRTKSYYKLPTPLSAHPDMLIYKDSGVLISSAAYVEAAPMLFDDLSRLTRLNFRLTSSDFSDTYPKDCIFNALLIGNKLFAKTDSIDPAVLTLARECGREIIHVNQGYPACTVLTLNDSAAITADLGMRDALVRSGIDVTLIENGGISLPPYEYGFIGGCAGVYDGCVYFLGNPTTHPSWSAIESALLRVGLRFISLFDGPLLDLGRIVFAE